MDNIPKELEETPLNLEVLVDPKTKCVTMKTHIEKPQTIININGIPLDIISNDPLQGEICIEKSLLKNAIERETKRNNKKIKGNDDINNDNQNLTSTASFGMEPDLNNVSELDRLIYNERQRILNVRKPNRRTLEINQYNKDKITKYKLHPGAASSEDCRGTKQNESDKSKLRKCNSRERESSEERDIRKFRQRIVTMKMRLLQRLKNFDNETYLKEITRQNTAKIRQKRKELREKETPEQTALRRSRQNTKSRLRNKRRKAFKAPEELEEEKDKRLAYLEKYWSRYTEEERRERQSANRDRARERYRKNSKEWKKFDMFLKGAPLEILEQSETN